MRYKFFYVTPFLIALLFLVQLNTRAQAPNKMSYQAVIRDNKNNLIINSEIGIRISIIQGSHTNAPIYTETHLVTSNTNGLITLEIGDGLSILNTFNAINWALGPHFLQTEVDPTGGIHYTISGISQLLSVPFALHAKTASQFTGTLNENDPKFTNSTAATISQTDIDNWNSNVANLTGNEAQFKDWDKNKADDFSGVYSDLSDKPTKVSEFTNDAGYIKNESDPEFNSSIAAGISKEDTAAWNAASIGIYTEIDPVFLAWDKTTGILISKSQITDLSFALFEKELSDNENKIDVGFKLEPSSEVFINGLALPNTRWTGIGTQILNLNSKNKLYDKLKVKK